MYCLVHDVSFPYRFAMSEQYAVDNAFYELTYDGGNTRTVDSFVDDFVLVGKLNFYSDWKDKRYSCSPEVHIQNA